MSAFGTESLKNLQGVHPDLVKFFGEVTVLFDCSVLPGSCRTLAQEAENVAKHLSTTLNSKHIPQADGYSHAVDVACNPQTWDSGEHYNRQLTYFAGFVAGYLAANPAGLGNWNLRWGGDWDRDLQINPEGSFQDLDHFELEAK